MTRWLPFIVGLSVLFLGHGDYWDYHWASKWELLLVFFSLCLAHGIWWKVSPPAGLLTAYCLLSCLTVGIWNGSPYRHLADDVSLLALERNALYAYIVVAACALTILRFRHSWCFSAKVILLTLWFIGVMSTLLQGAGQPALDGLYFGNPSMGMCLMAALLPLVLGFIILFIPSTWMRSAIVGAWLLTAIAIWRTGTSIPVGILGVGTAALFFNLRPTQKRAQSLLFLAFLMLLGGHFLIGDAFFDNNGRLDVWRQAMTWWQLHMPAALGSGIGTAQIILPSIQGPGHSDYFLWLHNDWLQLLFEGGYVGLVLALFTWADLMRKAWNRPALFAMLSAYTVMGLMNYPLRSPIHAFCLLMVVCLIVQASVERPRSLPSVPGCR